MAEHFYSEKCTFIVKLRSEAEKLARLRAKIEDVETLAKFLFQEFASGSEHVQLHGLTAFFYRSKAARLKAHLLEEE